YVEAVPRYGLVAGLLTVGAITGVGLAAAAVRRRRPRAPDEASVQPPELALVGAFALCFLVVLLLQLGIAAPVWRTVPLISYVQFPQRLFVFGSFAGAVIVGAVPWAVRAL